MGKMVKEGSINLAALAKTEADVASLDERTIEQLRLIESAIAKEIADRAMMEAKLKENPFTIRGMSKRAGLSRSTFYNKPLLADYLNARTSTLTINHDKRRILELEQELEEANSTIAALRRRDGELELLLQKYLKLEKQAKDKQRYIDHELSLLYPDLSAGRRIW